MINIYVARHGQDIDNSNGILNGHRNEPLTDLGRQQALDVGKKMLREGFRLLQQTELAQYPSSTNHVTTALSAIYSSPLQRAYETAQIFADILSGDKKSSNEVQVLDALIERDFGIMTGMPTSSILEKCGRDRVFSTETIDYFIDPAGAETFDDLIIRAKKLLSYIEQEIGDNNDDTGSNPKSILLVTHGDFGKMLYAAFYGRDWKDVLKQFHFGNSEVLLLAKDSPPENAHVFETSQFNS